MIHYTLCKADLVRMKEFILKYLTLKIYLLVVSLMQHISKTCLPPSPRIAGPSQRNTADILS